MEESITIELCQRPCQAPEDMLILKDEWKRKTFTIVVHEDDFIDFYGEIPNDDSYKSDKDFIDYLIATRPKLEGWERP